MVLRMFWGLLRCSRGGGGVIFLGFIAINKADTDNLDFPKYIKEAFFILLGGDSRFSC